MTRITQFTLSTLATLALAVGLAAPVSAYESPNAALNAAPSADQRSDAGVASINAIVAESTSAGREQAGGSSPNAILGGANVGEPVILTSTIGGSTGFDWNDALVGAGSALALVLFTGGAMVLARRRRAPRVQPTI